MRSEKGTMTAYVEQILLSEYNRYFRLAMSFVHNEADAGDIVQSGAYKAIRGSRSLRKREYARTWIYRIMLHEIFRVQKTVHFVPLDAVAETGREDTYENFDLKRALDSLPGKEKAVVELRYFEELKLEEIAEILQENVSTVKSRLYRSMKKLRVKLEEEPMPDQAAADNRKGEDLWNIKNGKN